MRFLNLTLLFVAVFTAVLSSASKPDIRCSPLGGRCRLTEDCCDHLACLFYLARCVQAL
ncbi:uncharacterized protein LOC122530159 [Frieseomelitta varia]|uniref:uncharacterized protein LOC122530159 n=1 Tax=Frieseomelitta varia TaxID=561572 RepID=UPI001CB684D1|nr:uncharacterized protein LOC122530159 [Frieseomelitta varia]